MIVTSPAPPSSNPALLQKIAAFPVVESAAPVTVIVLVVSFLHLISVFTSL